MVKVLHGDGKAILMVFIGAIITIVFLQSISDTQSFQVNTFTENNLTVTAPAVNASVALSGRELIGTATVQNGTTNISLEGAGVFVNESVINGIKSVRLNVNQTGAGFAGTPVNVTYTAGADGYLERSVDRTISNLIPLFAALAILIFVLVIFIMNGTLGEFMKGFTKRER